MCRCDEFQEGGTREFLKQLMLMLPLIIPHQFVYSIQSQGSLLNLGETLCSEVSNHNEQSFLEKKYSSSKESQKLETLLLLSTIILSDPFA